MTDLWFVTTDEKSSQGYGPLGNYFLMKWDGSSYTQLDTATASSATDWFVEPSIGLATKNGITAVVLQRGQIADDNTVSNPTEVKIYSGETLLRTTMIMPAIFPVTVTEFYDMSKSRYVVMDSAGRIHVLVVVWKVSGVVSYSLYDCISSDNGATFTAVQIATGTSWRQQLFLEIDSSDNLYVFAASQTAVYKSTDNGQTWTTTGSGTIPANSTFVQLVNGKFFATATSGTDVILYSNSDLTGAWSSALITFSGAIANFFTPALAYDGTYYYFVTASFTGANNYPHSAYRSSDGATWALLTSFTDNFASTGWSQLLVDSDGTLYYLCYYSETNTTNYFITFWKSIDQAANWTSVTTPFWDANKGNDPGGSSTPWYSCPMGIIFRSSASSASPSLSPSSSPSISPSLSPSFAYTTINPKVMLQWSDDGGQTWSNEYWRDPGRIGEFRTRLRWLRLGYAKDRVFKIAVSDPCKWIFIDAHIEAELGTRR